MPIWNGGFDFQSRRFFVPTHKPMTTCRDTVADWRLFCRVLFSFSQYPWSAPAKKSVAPPSEQSGFEYELYHVNNRLYKTFLRPAGQLRLAGRFLLFSEDKPASKKFFEKFSKRRLLAGSERLCVRLVSGKGETHLIPPGKGVKRWIWSPAMTMASGASSMLTANWYCTMRQSTTSGKCRGVVIPYLIPTYKALQKSKNARKIRKTEDV